MSTGTSITREYAQAQRDPYVVAQEENGALFKRYEALATDQKNLTFVAGWRSTVTTTWIKWWERR